jgi:serine protease AprX
MIETDKVPIIIVLKDQKSIGNFSRKDAILMKKNHTSNSQKSLLSLLKEEKIQGKAERIKQFWIVNAISVNASAELIEKLSKREDVEYVQPNSVFHILENYSTSISADQISNATNELELINTTQAWEAGIDGTEINVSVLDTGINASHPDIAGRMIDWNDFVNGFLSPYDDLGHGTHVAGTVAGNGMGGITTGVAPNVSLMIAKVCNLHGSCMEDHIIDATQWSVENNSDIISMSFGGGLDTTLKAAIDTAVSMGVVIIAAAGNEGPGAGTIQFPAGEKNVIAVGAVDDFSNIAGFSSRGPINIDGETLTKPDVSAPGVSIISLNYHTNGYAIDSGTSMATPHVSGMVALLLQAAKKKGIILSPAQVKNILENTSVDIGVTGKDNTYGAGRIDVFNAIKFYILPEVNGSIIDNNTNIGIKGALVTTNTSINAITDTSGFYSFKLPPGNYNITATGDPEYYLNSSIVVITAYDTNVIQDFRLIKKPTGNITGSITGVSQK